MWSPAHVSKKLLSISFELTDPNPSDFLVPKIAQPLLKDKSKHGSTARDWEQKSTTFNLSVSVDQAARSANYKMVGATRVAEHLGVTMVTIVTCVYVNKQPVAKALQLVSWKAEGGAVNQMPPSSATLTSFFGLAPSR